MNDFMITEFITRLLRNAPALIVLVLCAAMIFAQWQRHPRAAFRAALAFCWFLFYDFLALFWWTIGFRLALPRMQNPQDLESFSETTLSCVEAIGYLLVLYALNAARVPYRPPEFYDDPRDFEERLKFIQDGSFTTEEPRHTEGKQKES